MGADGDREFCPFCSQLYVQHLKLPGSQTVYTCGMIASLGKLSQDAPFQAFSETFAVLSCDGCEFLSGPGCCRLTKDLENRSTHFLNLPIRSIRVYVRLHLRRCSLFQGCRSLMRSPSESLGGRRSCSGTQAGGPQAIRMKPKHPGPNSWATY